MSLLNAIDQSEGHENGGWSSSHMPIMSRETSATDASWNSTSIDKHNNKPCLVEYDNSEEDEDEAIGCDIAGGEEEFGDHGQEDEAYNDDDGELYEDEGEEEYGEDVDESYDPRVHYDDDEEEAYADDDGEFEEMSYDRHGQSYDDYLDDDQIDQMDHDQSVDPTQHHSYDDQMMDEEEDPDEYEEGDEDFEESEEFLNPSSAPHAVVARPPIRQPITDSIKVARTLNAREFQAILANQNAQLPKTKVVHGRDVRYLIIPRPSGKAKQQTLQLAMTGAPTQAPPRPCKPTVQPGVGSSTTQSRDEAGIRGGGKKNSKETPTTAAILATPTSRGVVSAGASMLADVARNMASAATNALSATRAVVIGNRTFHHITSSVAGVMPANNPNTATSTPPRLGDFSSLVMCPNCGQASKQFQRCDSCSKPIPATSRIINATANTSTNRFYSTPQTNMDNSPRFNATNAVNTYSNIRTKRRPAQLNNVRSKQAKIMEPEVVTINSSDDEESAPQPRSVTVHINRSFSDPGNALITAYPANAVITAYPANAVITAYPANAVIAAYPGNTSTENRVIVTAVSSSSTTTRSAAPAQTTTVTFAQKVVHNNALATTSTTAPSGAAAAPAQKSVSFEALTVFVGTLRGKPYSPLLLSRDTLNFEMEAQDETVKLIVPMLQIVSCSICTDFETPAILLDVDSKFAETVCASYSMTLESGIYFNPQSIMDKHKKMIVIMKKQPQEVTERMLSILRDVSIARAEMTTKGTNVLRFLNEVTGAESLGLLTRCLGADNDVVKRYRALITQKQQLTINAARVVQTSMPPSSMTTTVVPSSVATTMVPTSLGPLSRGIMTTVQRFVTPLLSPCGRITVAGATSPHVISTSGTGLTLTSATPGPRIKMEMADDSRSRSPTPPRPIYTGPVVRLFTYPPPPATGAITVSTEDLICLNDGEFTNDVIIDFYIRYLVLTQLTEEQRQRTHVFSSFFYRRLTQRPARRQSEDISLSLAKKRHNRVKTWTRQVDIFTKDFLIVPINESAHWFLAIVCFPSQTGPSYKRVPITKTQVKSPESAAKDLVKQDSKSASEPEDTVTKKEGEPAVTGQDESQKKQEIAEKSIPSEGMKGICDKQPCILVMDSLAAGTRGTTVRVIRDYLQVEWDVRKKETNGARAFTKDKIRGSTVKVPQQSNFSDCGLYVLQYVEQFFKDPIEDYTIPINTLENWFPQQVCDGKRQQIRQLIFELQKKLNPGLDLKYQTS